MKKKTIIIDANFPLETRVALLDKNNNIENVEFTSQNKKQIKGNIYLAKITRVEPSLQAAFVDYGEDKSGFLPFNEIHPDYYQLHNSEKENKLIGTELKTPEITDEDKKERIKLQNSIIDDPEININAIQKLIDGKIASDINIEADEDEFESISTQPYSEEKKYKIQEVMKKGQIILIQATKEERGNKGASMTSYISLAGRYCVLMPNKPFNNGISRKISNNEERRRLKGIITKLTEDSDESLSSVIARTSATGHTTLEIKKDFDYLAKLWNKIREVTLKSNAPCFIHQEDGILLKTIRDVYDRNVKDIMVQGKNAYDECIKYMQDLLPDEIKNVKEYKGKTPIFTKYAIENQLINLYQPVAHLPSGGYIVINPTEALISIDVNSGKATNERNIEEMALKINLEAAREIARQARLRDLSGLLVLDFIDMAEAKNRKILERSLWEYFGKDKAKIQTTQVSIFGLLEMSRQRLRPSFLEMNSNMCSHCSGKGLTRSEEANSMLILRTIENEIYNNKHNVVNVYAIANSVLYLLNEKREEIAFIENKYGIRINFFIDNKATSDSYSIEKIILSDKNKNNSDLSQPALQDTSEIYSLDMQDHSDKKKRIMKSKRFTKEVQQLDKNDTIPDIQNEKPQEKSDDDNSEDEKDQEALAKKKRSSKRRVNRKRLPQKPTNEQE